MSKVVLLIVMTTLFHGDYVGNVLGRVSGYGESNDDGDDGSYNENDYYNEGNDIQGNSHYPKYSYQYGVNDGKSGDTKTQQEERDGDTVKGFYTVKEADGTSRTVHYTADGRNGFQVVIIKSGHRNNAAPHESTK